MHGKCYNGGLLAVPRKTGKFGECFLIGDLANFTQNYGGHNVIVVVATPETPSRYWGRSLSQ